MTAPNPATSHRAPGGASSKVSKAPLPDGIDRPTPLLGGLSPQQFMRRHWQKRPLLIRQALAGVEAPVSRSELFAMATRDDVESRLVVRDGSAWTLRHGPLRRRSLPGLRTPGWTLLVQGLDLLVPAAHDLLQRFSFVPAARLDDLMISYATDSGGVGPHVDSYDVFLLQVHGVREWRIGRVPTPHLQADAPLKILTNFIAEQAWRLEPGDMLYLPPGWAHDGVARGECMTCSIGFRAAAQRPLANEVMQRVLDGRAGDERTGLYRDPHQSATDSPGRVPADLQAFAARAVAQELADPRRLACALGEWLSEPKPNVVFDAGRGLNRKRGVRLDLRTRMLYDDHHVFVNAEAHRATGADAKVLRRLADRRALGAADLAKLSAPALALLDEWARAGWLHAGVASR
jgi:50S ribosomal protein L16 3-hydroxylase